MRFWNFLRDRITPLSVGWLPPLLILLPVFFSCAEAWARAGGGHSFGGGGGHSYSGGGGHYSGGGSSHGSSSGGGDLFILIYYLIRFLVVLCIDHPFIGLPLTTGLGFLLYHMYRQWQNACTGRVIRRGRDAAPTLSLLQINQRLGKTDPDFSAQTFLSRADRAFHIAQQAWCDQDLNPLRPFVSDGVYERWSLQITELKENGLRDRMDNLRLHSSHLVDCRATAATEELTVAFAASAADYRVRLNDGRPVAGADRSEEPFTEFWTFVRRPGSRSLRDKDGLMEGRCPNCGHPVGINQSARCEGCGAFLRSGEFDWILSEITQESEYQPDSGRIQPGVNELTTRDPYFTPQLAEERAAVVFWHWLEALRKRKREPLCGGCQPELVDAIAQRFQKFPAVSYQECAVGAVNLLGIVSQEDRDHALVEIVWSGEKIMTAEDGSRRTGQKTLSRTLFVLARAKGAPSLPQLRVGSAHCPSCGAPETADSAGLCIYCGQPLNSLQTGWLVCVLCDRCSEAAARWLERLPSPRRLRNVTGAAEDAAAEDDVQDDNERGGFSPSAYAVLAWMVKMVTSDNEIAPSERALLMSAARSRRIPQSVMESMLSAASAGQFQPPEPQDKTDALEWLRGMARLALADGTITAQEHELLQTMAEKCGYTDYDLQLLLKKERAQMYRQAKEDLRQTRQIPRRKST